MNPNIIIRADGSSQIGLGHIVRCLALVKILSKDFHCLWIIQKADKAVLSLIYNHCPELVILPELSSADEALFIASKYLNPGDIVILDGYHFNTQYQQNLLQKKIKLVCLDDLYSNEFLAHAIINPCGNIVPAHYKAQTYTRFYLGPRYSILRDAFLTDYQSHRSTIVEKPLFINLGGADPENYVVKVLTHLVSNHKQIKVLNIVVGSAYQYLPELHALVASLIDYKIKIFRNLDAEEMARLMAESSMGICAASGVSYEYCSISGLLYIVLSAQNQINNFQYFINAGLAYDFFGVDNLIVQPNTIIEMVERQKKVFDGRSALRLLSVFQTLNIERNVKMRKALPEDMSTYLEWANDESVRSNSINKQKIELIPHQTWYLLKIESPLHRFYVFEINETPIGQVRLDISESILINFSVEAGFRGQGLGEIIVQKAMLAYKDESKKIAKYVAMVLETNNPSINIFKKLGFSSVDLITLQSQTFIKFEKTI